MIDSVQVPSNSQLKSVHLLCVSAVKTEKKKDSMWKCLTSILGQFELEMGTLLKGESTVKVKSLSGMCFEKKLSFMLPSSRFS